MNRIKTAGHGRESDGYERTPFGWRQKSKNTDRIKSAMWCVVCAAPIFLWTQVRRGMARLVQH